MNLMGLSQWTQSDPSPLPNIPQDSSRTTASVVLLPNIDSRVHITRGLTPRPHNSGESPCNFTMTPCVVVEWLEGKQQCSRDPVGEHAEVQAQDEECGCHEQQEVNKTPQQPITQSRQHGAQTTSAHLYWCGADPSGPWPAPVASHGGNCPERIHIFTILAGLHIFVYVYKVHMCTKCWEEGWGSLTNCCTLAFFPSKKAKQKMCT